MTVRFGPVRARRLVGVFGRHPRGSAVGVAVADAVLLVVLALLLRLVAPELEGQTAALVVLAVLAVVLAGVVTWLGWWRRIGFVGWRWGRRWRLLIVPVLATLLPFAGGVRTVPAGTFAVLVVGYALTGFYEETLFRGLVLRILQPRGVWTAALLSALLFGLSHGTNVLFRGNVALVGAQMLGSFCDGVGMAALVLAMGTIWPAVVIHGVHDLFLQLGPLPVPLVSAAYDVILLVFGLVVLGGLVRSRASTQVAPGEPSG